MKKQMILTAAIILVCFSSQAFEGKDLEIIVANGNYKLTRQQPIGHDPCPETGEFAWMEVETGEYVFRMSPQIAVPMKLAHVNGRAVADPDNKLVKGDEACRIFETFRLDEAKKSISVLTEYKCKGGREVDMMSEYLYREGNILVYKRVQKDHDKPAKILNCRYQTL